MIPPRARRWRVLASAVLLVSTLLPAAVAPALAVSPTIVISGVYGGGGNSGATYTHDFVELFNRGSTSASLAGWSIQYASATGTGNLGATATQITELPAVSLAPGQYLLVQAAQGSGGTTPLPAPDVIDLTPIALSATGGKVALANVSVSLGCNGSSTPCTPGQLAQIVDLVGWGAANFHESSPAPATTNTTALARTANGCADTDNNASDFTAGSPAPRNTATPLSPCPIESAPSVLSTDPTSGATGFPYASNLSVTFSEPVNTGAGTFSLVCSTSGTVDLAVSGGPTTFTLDPAVDLADGETCTLTVASTGVTDQDANDPPDNMAADHVVGFTPQNVCQQAFTPIPAIQGSGPAAAITGPVTTMGVVVGDHEGPAPSLRGFYVQDPSGDADAATSDGIFVFNGNNNSVALGELVRVTGTAAEFQGQTQVTASGIVTCGTGTVTPTDVTLPVATADALERFEGMLVRLPQTLLVTETFQLGRFGQVVMSSGARLRVPTGVVSPGADALALQAANNLNRIIIDDSSQAQNPDPILFARGGQPLSASNTLRGGDTATGTVGVMTYTWAGASASGNAFRVRPIGALGGQVMFEAANPRPAAAPEVGGSIRVAGLNLLNYYNTFDGLPDTVDNCTMGLGGAPTDCRGADTAAEFARQWPKTAAAILRLDADVIGFNEIENDGYGPDSAIADLVDRLNAATAPGTYAFVDADAGTGKINALGVDAIKVGMVYRPDVVTPVGTTAVLDSDEFVNGGDAVLRSRPSLAQAFEVNATGARFIVDTNHLKSKGSACTAPDAGDGQGNCNAVRTNAANALVDWLATDPTDTGDPDILLIGDYNAYAKEDPIAAIEAGGYTNLVADLIGPDAYSYVFDGQWGYLDYAFASPSLRAQVSGVAEDHVNADEPSVLDYNTDFKTPNLQAILYAPDEFRVSDHDPVVVGLELFADPKNDRPANGSGWFTTPAGAYTGMPGATGKTQFAFDAKYVKSASTPHGSAFLSFPAGGLTFVSGSLDWLVTNAPTATIQGTGFLNGAAGHRFRVTAHDGSPALLRFQVWAPDGTVVYDSGGPVAIGGGSISVRPPK